MLQLVDVKRHLGEAMVARRRSLMIFIISTILIVGLDTILMLTSQESYVLELIFTILFTSLYLGFLAFYFTVLRKRIMSELNFYFKLDQAELNEARVELIEFEKEIKNYNGLDFFVLKAITKNNLNDVEQFYYVPNKFEFKKGDKKTIRTFGSVIVEVRDER